MKKSGLFLLLVFCFVSVFAQFSVNEVLDEQIRKSSELKIYPFDQNNVLILEKKPNQVFVNFYDGLFNRLAQKEVALPISYSLRQAVKTNESYYFLFKKNNNKRAIILKVKPLSKSIEVFYKGKVSYSSFIKALNDKLLFVQTLPREILITEFNEKTGQKRLRKIKGLNVRYLSVLMPDSVSYVLSFVSKNTLNIVLPDSTVVRKELKKHEFIQSLHTCLHKDDSYYFIGTYSKKKDLPSLGYVFIKIRGGKIEILKYYSFVQLKNINPEIVSVKKRKRKNIFMYVQGYNLGSAYDLITIGQTYTPIYSSEYHSPNEAGYTFVKMQNFQCGDYGCFTTEFLGYQYHNALVLKFDDEGQVKWINTIGLNKFLKNKHLFLTKSMTGKTLVLRKISKEATSVKFDINKIDKENGKMEHTTESFKIDKIPDKRRIIKSLKVSLIQWYSNKYLVKVRYKIPGKRLHEFLLYEVDF